MKRALLMAGALLQASCASVHHELAEGRSPGTTGGTGAVVLSLSHPEDQDHFPPRCRYRGLGTGVDGETPEMTSWRAGLDQAIFRTPPKAGANPESWTMWGRVTVLDLPEGEYEFYSCTARALDGRKKFSTAEAFSLRFKVLAGTTVYLGALRIDFHDRKVAIAVEDRRDRDLEVARAKWPVLGLLRIDSQLMRWPGWTRR